MAELSKNATKIMDLVKELTIVELNDLVKAIEKEFGISSTAPVMVAWAEGGTEKGEAEEKSSFDLELISVWASKIAVIKIIRELTGVGLKDAKNIADNGGKIKEGMSKDDAETAKTKLEEVGASVELK